MRHELNAYEKHAGVIVNDTNSTTPLVTLSVTDGTRAMAVSLNVQQLDELITTLQFYKQRLEF